MEGSTPQPSAPVIDLRNPSISISEVNREGVVNAMFQRDPAITEWLVNQFFDSHIERNDSQGIEIIPNANYYLCPMCNTMKSREASLIKSGYHNCSGTKESPHAPTYTSPQGWGPLLKTKGLYYLLGMANATLNTNIGTGNRANSEADEKRKMSLEDRMRYEGWYVAYSGIAVIVGQYNVYVADWILKEKKLHGVFSVGFVTNFIITMTNNIVSNATKGKGMAAAGKAMENKVSMDSTTHHDVQYSYPAMAGANQRKGIGENISNMFGFGNNNKN